MSIASRRWPAAISSTTSSRTEPSIRSSFRWSSFNTFWEVNDKFSIVPILVGSFHDLMEKGVDPIADADVSRFVNAVRAAEVASGKRVAYIGGIDLCHVGPEFGDSGPVEPWLQEQVRQFDSTLLDRAAACDPLRLVPHGGRHRESTEGLRAGGDLHHAARDRAGPGPAAQLQASDRRRRALAASALPAWHFMPLPLLRPRPRTMSQPTTDPLAAEPQFERPPCPAPAQIRHEVARYDALSETCKWDGPDYQMTFRMLGDGPPLFVIPGIASTYHVYALLLNQLATRFRTIIYDYPGEHPGDGARLGKITHDSLVDHLFGLIDHLNVGRAFLAGLSFGSTVTLKALHREPRRFPRAAVQGAFAHRSLSVAERLALALGRLVPGNASSLPFRRTILTYNGKPEFPAILADRWPFYLEKNGDTPIRSLAHRVGLLSRLDLRPDSSSDHDRDSI